MLLNKGNIHIRTKKDNIIKSAGMQFGSIYLNPFLLQNHL